MTPRLLWTTVPEKLPVRAPTAIFTDLRRDVGRKLLEQHPTVLGTEAAGALGGALGVGGTPVYNFAADQPAGGYAFQEPGEGPWAVFPRVELAATRARVVSASRARVQLERIDVAVEAARELAALLHAGGPLGGCVVWHLTDNGLGSGVLGIGAAKALGRAVVVSTGAPDALSLAVMRTHGVELRAIYNAEDAIASIAGVKGW